jgi:hypothetical protein
MEARGFLGALFDFSFSEFLTPKIIKILYGIGLVLAAIGALVFIGAGFHRGAAAGIIFLIISPLVFLLYALGVRVYLEILIVLFRIAGWVEEIAGRSKPRE